MFDTICYVAGIEPVKIASTVDIDLFSRQVAGFAMCEQMPRPLVIDALRMACSGPPTNGLIFHSDRGSQDASGDFQKQRVTFGMKSSMRRKGDCWGQRRGGRIAVRFVEGRKVARNALRHAVRQKDEVIDWLPFYNHRRLHSNWDISARSPSRKNGLPTKNGSWHNRSAKGGAKPGQVHCAMPRRLWAPRRSAPPCSLRFHPLTGVG
jgi:transposase InsO family protein